MAANSHISVTELDFNGIRDNLKNFLGNQDEFRDYDFEGSSMAVLLDILAYNTHYQAYYTNMLANEMFLDTAQQRDSVVSRARELGYVPNSARGARARIRLTFDDIPSTVNHFTIPARTKFGTTLDDTQFTFVTDDATSLSRSGNTFISEVGLREGVPLTHRFRAPTNYTIPNPNVDASSVKVRVEGTEYIRATNLENIDSESKIYFLEEVDGNRLEIVFGDGVLGRKPVADEMVEIEFLAVRGPAANGARSFSLDGMINIGVPYTGTPTITLTEAATGGRDVESVESIKFNAPRNFQTQNRAVVGNDYSRILLKENPDLQSVTSFGGETVTPPIYGKVFIAVKPFGATRVSNTRKESIRVSIMDRTPLAIDPVILDASTTRVIPTITTHYDTTRTTASRDAIASAVRSAVVAFSRDHLERFGNRLRYSRFIRELDNVETGAILNTDATIRLRKTQNDSGEIDFNNAVVAGKLTSATFTRENVQCTLTDTAGGIVSIVNSTGSVVLENAGTINHATGKIVIFPGNVPLDTEIDVVPVSLDVVPVREQILVIDAQDATVEVVGEAT